MKNISKKYTVYTIISIMVLLGIATLITWAVFFWTDIQNDPNILSTLNCVEVNLINESEAISLTDTYPMTDTEGLNTIPYTFTIINNCPNFMEYALVVSVIDDVNNIPDTYIKVAIDGNTSISPTKLTNLLAVPTPQELANANIAKTYHLKNGFFTANNQSETYEFRMWLDGEDPAIWTDNTLSGKNLALKITLVGTIKSEIIGTITNNPGLVGLIYQNEYLDGEQQITVNGETYDVKITNFYDDVNYTTNPEIEATDDGPMVILIYHQDLTINNGVTLTPKVRTKGLMIVVKGNLINNGIITMTARGAVAVGQNIYLLENSPGNWEYVPALGGTGGLGDTTGVNSNGNQGVSGLNRGTGGGGSGGSHGTNPLQGGNGGTGTSYSGGSGGGGSYHASATGTFPGENGSNNGGSGGSASARGTTSFIATASGGAGNPSGSGAYSNNTITNVGNIDNIYAEDGTGGLLIIYANNLANSGTISANGSNVVSKQYDVLVSRYAGGGGSGGGSVNIFYNNILIEGKIEAKGGTSTVLSEGIMTYLRAGSAGGNGSVAIQKVIAINKDLGYLGYIEDGLILHLDGIENSGYGHNGVNPSWKDLSGNNNDINLHNFAYNLHSGWSNNALVFNGVNNYGIGPEINYNQITLEVIYELTAFTGDIQTIVANYESGGYAIDATNTRIDGTVYINGAYRYVRDNTTPQLNVKNKHILTYDGGVLKLYKNNGSLLESLTISGVIKVPDKNTHFALGVNPSGASGTGRYFNGRIYAVRIYDRALTAGEIMHNYNIDKTRFSLED